MNGIPANRYSMRRVLPVVVWLAAVGTAYWLYRGVAGSGMASGVAEILEFTVSSIETGRLASIDVSPGELVTRGQVVAEIDADLLDRELAVAGAELRELEAKVPAEYRTLELSGLESERAFQRELEEAEIEVQAAAAGFAQDRAELEGVREELNRQRDLVARRLAQADRMKDLEVRLAGLTEAVAAWPPRMAVLEKRQQAARQRLAEWRSSRAGGTSGATRHEQLRPLQLRILRQHEYLGLLRERRAKLMLRAPADGRVTTIVAREGAVLKPGDPVLAMVETEPRQVIGYVEDDRGVTVSAGDQAVMSSRTASGEQVLGTVTGIAGMVSQIPARFWPNSTRPRWGREVFIRIDSTHQLDPGQAVDIRFARKGSVVAASSGATPSSGELAPLVISASVSSRSRFEPSGIVWIGARDRYIVASDDTGLESANDNAPWLFTVSRTGVVDPDPLPIQGVGAVNDIEGITAAADGTIYAIASQSINQKGRRRPPRTVFIEARLDGKVLRATHQVYFHDLLARAAEREAGFLASLGLVPEPGGSGPELEIEGLSWHDGALFLGLKAPLDAQGNALILKLAEPDALFRGGSLSRLSLWNKVLLAVEGKPAGISELLFLDDDTLLIAGTNIAGGAVFRAKPVAGAGLEVAAVASFPRLKPEGLCPAPDGKRITVVFDRQQQTPLWTQLEVPR